MLYPGKSLLTFSSSFPVAHPARRERGDLPPYLGCMVGGMDFELRKPETRAQRVGPLCEEQCHGNLRLRTYEGMDERQGENGGEELT